MTSKLGRPKPVVVLSRTDKQWMAQQVLAADAIYAVFYRGKPINLRSVNDLEPDPTKAKRYCGTTFCNPGYAFALQRRLAATFGEGFSVVRLTVGETVEDSPSSGRIPAGKGR